MKSNLCQLPDGAETSKCGKKLRDREIILPATKPGRRQLLKSGGNEVSF
jgi:hypothetical protein